MTPENALQTLAAIVDASVQSGVFKTAVAAGNAAVALEVVARELAKTAQLEAEIEKLKPAAATTAAASKN